MGWFSKDNSTDKNNTSGKLPELPRLPELPPLPAIKTNRGEQIHQLPSYPNSQFGQKFSQSTIKNAISSNNPGDKDGDRVFEADDFMNKKNPRMMPKPEQHFPPQPQVRRRQEIDDDFEESEFDAGEDFDTEPEFIGHENHQEYDNEFEAPELESSSRMRTTDPVFIRIDKFEASLKAFEKTKKQIIEMEKNLKEIAELKKEEERELVSWQQEILKVKDQIDRVDKDIFSKIQ